MREHVAAVAAAVFGLAAGIALLPLWLRPADPAQLPSYMTNLGFDARASYRFLAGIVVLTVLGPLVLRPLIHRLARAQTWAFVTAVAALSSSLWIALAEESLPWVIVPPLATAALCVALRDQRQAFSRRDAILLPAALCVFMALTDIAVAAPLGRRVVESVGLVLLVRLALPFIRRGRGLDAASCFALSPLALIFQSHYVGYHERHNGWPPLLVALLAPIVLRLLLKKTPMTRRRLRRAVALVVYPAAILAYASATSNFAAEGKAHADLFEDSHNLTVAAEMLRGERPYADINPTHGLIQDGLLDYVVMRTGKQSAGQLNAAHGVIGSLVAVAVYAIGACATGSPHVGLLTYFLAASINLVGGGVRAAPALFAMALLVAAVRRRRPRFFAYAAALFVLAALTSLDFASYTLVAAVVGILRMPAGALRRSSMRAALAGLLAAGSAVLVGLAVSGIVGAYLRTTLLEIPPLASLYSLTPFSAPESLRAHRFPPEVLAAFFDRGAFLYVIWVLVLIGVAIRLWVHGERRIDRWSDALLLLGVWMVAAGLSYAERQHLFFQFVAVPIAVMLATILRLCRMRAASALLIVALLILAQPTAYLVGIDIRRHAHGPFQSDVETVDEIPRARGALYNAKDAAFIRSANRYVAALPPNQTFFDFTGRGALYFLFDRDCPIRQVEPTMYEQPALQREVVQRLARNHSIRAVLVPKDGDPSAAVDGVPNRNRAPLVWQFIEQHFRPDFEEGDVIFWRRVDP